MALTAPAPALPKRNCLDCPSYVSPENYGILTGKAIGVGYCRSRSIALGMPGWSKETTKMTLTKVATECLDYGNSPKVVRVTKTEPVFLGDMHAPAPTAERKLVENLDDYGREKALVSSCKGCQFFTSDRIMNAQYGVSAGVCRAYNKLVNPLGATEIAQTCPTATYRGANPNTSLPVDWPFGPGVTEVIDIFSEGDAVLMKGSTIIEPNDWITDGVVTADDAAGGIQAWRKISDPSSDSRSVMLPIFRTDYFSADEQVKIPRTGDDEHPELYIDYSEAVYKVSALWMGLDETPAVWGEPGVGKTELFRHIAWMMQIPFERISITATSEVDDLAGKLMFTPEKGTYFQYGRIPQAWQKPCVLVIDEPNVGPPEVWHFIRPLTDNSKQMVLDQHNGERIKRNDFCFMGMAMNPAWDMRNVGAESVADADSSRLMHIFIDTPPEGIERRIIQDRLALDGWKLSDTRLKQMMTTAKEIRQLSSEGAVPISWGVRAQIKVARAMQFFSPADAYRIAATDFLEPEARESILALVKTNIHGDVTF